MASVLSKQSIDDTAFVLGLQTLEDRHRIAGEIRSFSTASPIICVSAVSAGAC